jgi:cytochrome oxidase Cu insertion factor (SCO1/SenC/PrrC family)
MVGGNAAAESVAEYMTTLGLTRFEQKVSAPDFTVTTITGETLRLRDLKGRVVLLNFWATW